MKKITLMMLCIAGCVAGVSAQNLVTNPGFENDINTATNSITVVEGTTPTNVLRRVDSHQAITTQVAAPVSTAIPVTAGMWVKKSPNSGYAKGVVVTNDFHQGTNSLNLKITPGTTGTSFVNYYQCVAQQKLATPLLNTKKYKVTFWAKQDPTSGNQCLTVYAFLTDNTAKVNCMRAVPLIIPTATPPDWAEYSAIFDIPAHIVSTAAITPNPGVPDFTTAFLGFGIVTTYDTASKTLYSGVLLDDISLTEEVEAGINTPISDFKCLIITKNSIVSKVQGAIEVLSFDGRRISNVNVTIGQEINLPSGSYIVRIKTNEGIFAQKVIL